MKREKVTRKMKEVIHGPRKVKALKLAVEQEVPETVTPDVSEWEVFRNPAHIPDDPKSSRVIEMAYRPKDGALEVEFVNGRYRYPADPTADRIPVDIWHAFMASESKGKFVNEVLIGKGGFKAPKYQGIRISTVCGK